MPRADHQRHILAGDDSPAILALLQEVLEDEGYRVSVSREALGLDEVKRIDPDLVILDHLLTDGVGSGWHLLRDLRADPITAHLPVILCTGAVERVTAEAEYLASVDATVVLKPFDIDDLLAVVSGAWSRRPLSLIAPSDAATP